MIKIVIILIAFSLLLAISVVLLLYKLKNIQTNYNEIKEEYQKFKESNEYKQREIDRMSNQIKIYEKKEEEIPTIKIENKKIQKNPIFKGKRALVGDYIKYSCENTIKILKSYGITVDVVHKGTDIVDKIKHGYMCDIIFTNNIYQEGYDGPSTLINLKEIENFNIPVVIHTISRNERHRFVDILGFDEYIVKPLTQDNTKPILDKLLNKKN